MKQEKSMKMKTMPIGRLIAYMSIPAMLSMFIQALYNIVDSYWVGKIDITTDNMITAVGIALPMQILMLAFALGIGIGTNILVSRKLGERRHQEASSVAQTGIVMGIIMGLVFFVLSFIIIVPFFELMSINKDIISHGTSYLRIIMMLSMGMFIEIICNKILQGMGRMIIPMITQLIGALVNIILDPILIFGMFGFPELGFNGAAIATVIAQFTAMLFVVTYIIIKKFEIDLSLKKFRFKKIYVKEITKAGLPVLVMNSIGSLTITALNTILSPLNPNPNDSPANAVLTSYFRLQSLIFMPVFGLVQGGMPILSYNYGANDKNRYFKALKILIISALVIMTIGFIIFQLFPVALLSIFSPTEVMLDIGINALKIISVGFLPASISIIITMSFQSIGRGEVALLMSLLRQAVFLIPLSFILGQIGGLDIVWFGFPISEFIVILLFIPIIIISIKRAFQRKSNLFDINKEDGLLV